MNADTRAKKKQVSRPAFFDFATFASFALLTIKFVSSREEFISAIYPQKFA